MSVPVLKRSVWASESTVRQQGWLNANKTVIYFTDGDSTLVTNLDSVLTVDFAALCKHELDGINDPKDDQTFHRMDMNAIGISNEAKLTKAAWLYKLGKLDLAASMYKQALSDYNDDRANMIATLKSNLAWSACADMIHAYMVRADEDAYKHGKRLMKLYDGKLDPQAVSIMAELERKKQEGTFGKPAPQKPADFNTWETAKQVDWLIQQLEEVDARQWGQPGGISFNEDWRVQEIIAMGDDIVPALITVIESDNRLTRCVHFWRDFARSRTVIGVHEVAVSAIMTILQVRVFEPASTGDNLTSRGQTGRWQTAADIKAYWAKHGGVPFHARQMKIITDKNSSLDQVEEAAYNLAYINNKRLYGTTVWSDGQTMGANRPNPAIGKHFNPTAAEALLQAFDRNYSETKEVNGNYILYLAALGDSAIAPELLQRFEQAKNVHTRRQWAYACMKCGNANPMKTYANEVAVGEIKTPGNKESKSSGLPAAQFYHRKELKDMISFLAFARMPEAEAALQAIANPKHPFYETFKEGVIDYVLGDSDFEDRTFISHPICLSILIPRLADNTETGERYWVEGKSVKSQMSSGPLRPILKNDTLRTDTVAERHCDIVAEELAFYTFGIPWYSIMLSDRDESIQKQKDFYNRFKMRKITEAEFEALEGDLPYFRPFFIPDIQPLGRVATAKDVTDNKAVFHLDGKGTKANVNLPQIVAYTGEVSGLLNNKVIVIQAEVDENGNTIYGILSGDGLKRVTANELIGIK